MNIKQDCVLRLVLKFVIRNELAWEQSICYIVKLFSLCLLIVINYDLNCVKISNFI